MKLRTLIVAAVLAVVASRIPFMLDNPDWGRVHPEHCFLLAAPAVHENRLSLEPDVPLPYWTMNPEQIRDHYHVGSACMFHLVHATADLLGTRSLVVLKVLGTAFMAVFVALLTAVLLRTWPERRDRFMVLAPLFACMFSPTFFLWISLTPQGHYFEYPLFYGLTLPFLAAAAAGRLSLRGLLLGAAIAGVATAYTVTHGLLVVVLLLTYILGGGEKARALPYRLGASALAGIVSLGVFCVVARPSVVIRRLTMPPLNQDVDVAPTLLGHGVTLADWLGQGHLKHALVSHVDTYFGLSAHPLLWTTRTGLPGWTGGPVAQAIAWLLALLTLAACAYLAWHTLRYLWPRTRRDLPLAHRLLGVQGLLFAGFVVSYFLLDPYLTPFDTRTSLRYLAPVFPPLFVGAAALLHAMRRHEIRGVRVAGNVVAGATAVMLLTGYTACYLHNSRPLERPELGTCDPLHLDAYFVEFGGSNFETRFDYTTHRARGVDRCQRALPGNDETCEFVGYVLDPDQGIYPGFCSQLPAPHAERCAQAYGAVHELRCDTPEAPPTDEFCAMFSGALRQACISGAYQGLGRDWHYFRCRDPFEALCRSTYSGAAEYSACAEQAAALLEGMPLLPPAPESSPARCDSWPAAWTGLCTRAAALADLPSPPPGTPSCEDAYLTTYSGDIPETGSLMYQQALAFAPEAYPWFAIGIARYQGEVSCVWRGDFDPGSDFFLGRTR
jgi:hypothetical protein